MAILVKPNIFVPGTVIRSAEVNDDFDTIYNDYNGNIRDVNIHLSNGKIFIGNASNQAVERTMSGDGTLSNTGVFTLNSGSVAALTFLPPIGTITAFYDFGGLLTFDVTKWAYCNGQAIAVGMIGVQTLPDLSNRYVVGFGTEGGMDIGTAPFATPAVGNASHQVNLAHIHDMGNHTHTAGAHTHSISSDGSHDHGGRNSQMTETTGVDEASWDYRVRDDAAGWVNRVAGSRHIDVSAGANDEGQHGHVISSDGSHNHTGSTGAGAGNTGGPSTNNTSSSLSATQSIQPRSIRVRFLMRIA